MSLLPGTSFLRPSPDKWCLNYCYMRLSVWLSQFELIFLCRLSYNAVLRPFEVRILASLFDHLLVLFVISLWLIIPFVYILSLQKFRRNILDFFRTVSRHNLSFPVRATEMRIYPKRAIDDVCMRLEIYGCLGKRSGCSFSNLSNLKRGCFRGEKEKQVRALIPFSKLPFFFFKSFESQLVFTNNLKIDWYWLFCSKG